MAGPVMEVFKNNLYRPSASTSCRCYCRIWLRTCKASALMETLIWKTHYPPGSLCSKPKKIASLSMRTSIALFVTHCTSESSLSISSRGFRFVMSSTRPGYPVRRPGLKPSAKSPAKSQKSVAGRHRRRLTSRCLYPTQAPPLLWYVASVARTL